MPLVRSAASTDKRASVHCLVAAAFIGARPVGREVNHKDGSKRNNRADNLEYVTHQENMAHAVQHGLFPCGDRSGTRKHPERYRNKDGSPIYAKLSSKNVVAIRRALLNKERGVKLAKQFDVSEMTISNLKRDRGWQHLETLRQEIRAAFC